jgi:hypothetical protein
MHRNQQRKEQQLLRFRQLPTNESSNHSSTSPPKQSTQQLSKQLSQQLSQHSPQQQLLIRSLCRNPRRDDLSKDLIFGSEMHSKSQSINNSKMSLRSVNSKSPPTTTQLTSRRALNSNSIQSPNSRLSANINNSLPLNSMLSPNLVKNQTKQSLAQINSNNSDIHKVRHKSLVENQNKQKSSTTSTTTTTEPNISPEILFLIKEQAKAIAKINALQKKVEQLELSVNYQNNNNNNNSDNCVHELSHETSTASSSSTTKLVNNSNSCKERNVISDDSGGEYSRATTTASDEDELSSLLDQIARCSQQLQNSQQQNKLINQSNSSNSININSSNRLLSQSMQMRQKLMHSLSNPTIQTSHSSVCPTIEMTQDNNTFNNCHQSHQQSISALLFEPNVETVLKNLDEIIADKPIACSNQLKSRSYQRQTSAQHSSPSLYEAIGITGIGSSSFTANNNNSSTNWHLERVKSIIKQREEREFESQMRLNDEWLATHLKIEPNPQQQHRLNNYIDSLEPTFR